MRGSNGLRNDEVDINQEKIMVLGEVLREKGFDPTKFLLWHRLNGSGIIGIESHVDLFDTPNNDIEDFIIENFEKYQ